MLNFPIHTLYARDKAREGYGSNDRIVPSQEGVKQTNF